MMKVTITLMKLFNLKVELTSFAKQIELDYVEMSNRSEERSRN